MFHKPLLTREPKNVTLVVGGLTNMSREILADLHVRIKWSRSIFYCDDSEDLNFALVKVRTE